MAEGQVGEANLEEDSLGDGEGPRLAGQGLLAEAGCS